MVFLHFSFLLPLTQAFCCLCFYRFLPFLPHPVTILLLLFVFQLPLLLPVAFISLPASSAPARALLASLRSLSISSPFLQLHVAIVRPTPAIHAHTLVSLALVAPEEAAAIPVRVLAITITVLLILTISIGLRHYYQQPFSSFSFSFFLLLIMTLLRVFHNLINLLKFQVFHFVAIIRVYHLFLNFLMVLSDLDNFIQEQPNFV